MKKVKLKTHLAPMKTKQSGFSLIELLIAMIIGLFLLAGIATSYVSSKKSSIERNQFTTLEENGRMALEVLSNSLQHTGYTSSNSAPLEDKFIDTAADVKSVTCGVPSVMNSGLFPTTFPANAKITNDSDSGDSVGVIYLGDSNIFTDCSGGTLPASCQIGSGLTVNASKIYSAFYLDATDLKCAGSRDNAVQLIAEGIENMQILYGVDADDDNLVDRYVKAPDVGTLWNNVINIQIAILARTLREIKDTAEQQKFTLLDYEHTTPTDRFQRAVFSTTISLRNSLN